MNGAHVEELAPLYVLGLLDAREAERLEAHLLDCARCAELVARAEADVAVLAASEPQRDAPPELMLRIERTLRRDDDAIAAPAKRRPSVRLLAAAVAAAFVLGIIPAAYFWGANRSLQNTLVADSAAMRRLAEAPHRVATFVSPQGSATAKVMYGNDGSWYVVMVPEATKPMRIAWMHDGRQTVLGDAMPYGRMALLYLPRSHRMDRLALMDGETIVAEAQLSYQ
jgi:anti-sigma factor RsiW